MSKHSFTYALYWSKNLSLYANGSIWYKIILMLLILLSNISIGRLSAQLSTGTGAPPPKYYECGIIEKLAGIPDDYNGQVLYDRFGNTWTVPELQALSANATANCDAGVFKLQFNGVPDYLESTICDVFKYVSITIGGGTVAKVPIQIDWVVLGGAAGAASDFQFYSDCNRITNTVQQGIGNSGIDLPPGTVAGFVRINSALSWYIGPANAISSGTFDLYTVVLHEALHLLGVASLIGDTGNTPHYTEYDRYLAHKTGAATYDPLIINVPDVKCCSVMADNPASTPNLLLGCEGNIFFTNALGSPTSEIVEVAYLDENGQPGSLGNMPNKLSHFDIRCGGGMHQYVMHPGIGEFPEPFSTPRRIITPPELEVLCRIGYPGAGSCNNCLLFVKDDNVIDQPIYLFSQYGAPNPNPSTRLDVDLNYTSSFYNLIRNDITPNVPDATFEVVTPHPGLTITSTDINPGTLGYLTVTVTDNTPGIKTFQYRLTACGQCKYGTVYIRVEEKPLSFTCEEGDLDCNLVCFGDFEDFPCVFSQPPNTFPFGYDVFGFAGQINSPDVTILVTPEGESKILSWLYNPLIGGTELGRMILSQPIYPGCTATISLRASAGANFQNLVGSPPQLQIFGITDSPCTVINELTWNGVGSSFVLCSSGGNTVDAICMAIEPNLNYDDEYEYTSDGTCGRRNNLTLMPYNFEFFYIPQGSNPQPIKELLIWGTFPSGEEQFSNFFIDDLYVTSDCNNQISVTPTVIQEACSGGQVILKYKVCLQGDGPSAPVQLQASIPPAYQQFVTFVPGGGFDANGLATFNLTPDAECNGGNNTTTLILTANIAANILPGTVIDLDMDVLSGNTCMNSSASDGNIKLIVQDCNLDPTACPCTAANSIPVGNNSNSFNYISNFISSPVLDNRCMSVNGKLVINKDLNLDKCTVIMNKGAEIEIQGGKQLTLTNGTSLYGCDHMWKGITVLGQGKLYVEGTATAKVSISDAQYAIKLLNGAEIKLLYATFDKNYTDVQAVSNSGLMAVTLGGIEHCTFTATGALKAGYPSQSPSPGSTPYTAFNLLNVVGFNFGSKAPIKVDNHRFGLRARESSFSMSNVTMSDFVGGDQDKAGVLATSCSSAKVKDCTINGFISGVRSIKSNTEVVGTKFNYETLSTISQTGITIFAQTGKLTKLRNNQIERCGIGIKIYDTYGNDGSEVYNNTIRKFYTPAGSNGVLSAIDLNNVNSFSISNNPIGDGSTGDDHHGLTMVRCSENLIANNTIGGMKRGIDNSSGSFNYFEQNTIQKHANGADLPSEGFYVSGSTDDYCYNTTKDLTEDGFTFVGVCDPSVVSRSQIYGAKTGLRIFANNSAIGEQNNYKNRWFGPFSSGFGAFHESSNPLDIIDSRFLTQINITPIWNTGAGSSTGWFQQIPNDPPYPFPQPLCPTYSASGKTSSTDEKTAQGDYTGPFAEAYTWDAQMGLYQRIQTDASVINNNTDVANFYQQSAEAPVGQFVQARNAIHEFFALNTGLRQQFYAGSVQATAINDALDVALEQPQPNMVQVRALQTQLRQSTRQFLALEKGYQQRQEQNLPSVKTLVNNLLDAQLYQSNEKVAWQYVLNQQLWQPDAQPSTTTVQELEAIAAQCAIAGGKGVYIARSLLQRWGMGDNWDDRLLCVVQKERNDDTEVIIPNWLVVPNPAQDILAFQHRSPLIADGRITVFNTLGTMVLQTTVAEGQRQVVIPVANWANGLYYYQIEVSDTAKQNGTFIIQH